MIRIKKAKSIQLQNWISDENVSIPDSFKKSFHVSESFFSLRGHDIYSTKLLSGLVLVSSQWNMKTKETDGEVTAQLEKKKKKKKLIRSLI